MNRAIELLIAFDEFEQKHPSSGLDDFCAYYLAQKSLPKTAIDKAQSKGQLLKMMGRLTSAFSLYHRAAMAKTSLSSSDSFYFLNGLAFLGEVKKTELINYVLVEYTTGMEVISRLLKEKLISERQDENDGRARIISLTSEGKKVLDECYAYASKASEMIFTDMSDNSIQLCAELLRDAEQRHSKLAVELKNKDFDEMYEVVRNHP
jgi:DNA-binding MarR family transcriptional regulator